jgi:hypothetical protein
MHHILKMGRVKKACFLFCSKLAACMLQVESCPYDPGAMVFMDYRDYDDKPEEGPPSFLYVMPMSSTQVFFEVSLCECPPVMF